MVPDLIWSLILLILFFLFLAEDDPDDEYDNEDTEGYSHDRACYLTYIPHICERERGSDE